MKVLVLLIFPLLLLFGCSAKNSTKNRILEIEKTNSIRYAKNFQISRINDKTFLEIMDPESGDVQRKIDVSEFTKSTNPITPALVALSSTHIGMISKLKEESKIVGVSVMQYVFNRTVKSNFEKGKIIELGEETSIPLEQLIKSKANIIVYNGFGQEFPHQKQLEKLGIICIPNYDWKEIHPLGKAEWIKVFGVLLGKEKEAENYFLSIEREYNELKESARNTVKSDCLFSGNVFGDYWYTPAGESFNAKIFKDANCDYAYADTKGTGSLSLNLEKVLEKNANCKFWINPGAKTLNELQQLNPKAIYFGAFKQQQVYCYTNSGNYFWEMSVIEPQKVLSDIIQITHPEIKIKNPLYFYTQLKS